MRYTIIIVITLGLALTSRLLASELEMCDMARVVTQPAPAQVCLAPVVITEIDGEKRAESRQGFLIEPGIHTINGLATLDSRKCPALTKDVQLGRAPALEVNFEARSDYHIAYDYGSPDSSDWKLVVWKVDQPGPTFQSCLFENQPYGDSPDTQ